MNYLSILTIASIMTIGLQAQIYDVYPCTRNRIFPPSSDIPANPIFLIQTIYDDEIILNLNKKYPVYLKSRQEKI